MLIVLCFGLMFNVNSNADLKPLMFNVNSNADLKPKDLFKASKNFNKIYQSNSKLTLTTKNIKIYAFIICNI